MSMTTQDMNALRHARAIIENVAGRSEFGRSINYIADKWNDGRVVLGLYEAQEGWNPNERAKYESEGAEFLNNLNEHLHLDGYHFDLTGVTEGKLYFSRDAEVDPGKYAFSSSDNEYSYNEEAAYQQYLLNKAEVQKKLGFMIGEAGIICNEDASYDEKITGLLSLQEGVGDSVSDAWTKFKNFLAKVWAKFNEFIARTLNSDKNYLTKYKDIILNKKFQLENVEVDADYKVGVERLNSYQVRTPNAAAINQIVAENNPENMKAVQKLVLPEYNPSSNIEFTDFCKMYFKGGDAAKNGTKHSLTEANVNMTDMFNYCFNYDKIRNVLNKNYGIMQKAGDAFIAMAKDLDKNNRGADGKGPGGTQTGNANSASTGGGDAASTGGASKPTFTYKSNPPISTKLTDPAKRKEAQDAITAYNKLPDGTDDQKQKKQAAYDQLKANKYIIESSYFMTYLGIPINEDVSFGSSGTGGTNAPSSNVKADANKVVPKGNVVQHQGVNNVKADGTVSASVDAKDMDKEAAGLTTKVQMYCTASQNVFTGMLTAAETIHKDYMKIIKAHVQSYLGDKESPNTVASAGTNFTGGTPNANAETISKLNNIKTQIENERKGGNNANTINQLLQQASAVANEGNTGRQISFSSEADIESYVKTSQDALDAQNKAQGNTNG